MNLDFGECGIIITSTIKISLSQNFRIFSLYSKEEIYLQLSWKLNVCKFVRHTSFRCMNLLDIWIFFLSLELQIYKLLCRLYCLQISLLSLCAACTLSVIGKHLQSLLNDRILGSFTPIPLVGSYLNCIPI